MIYITGDTHIPIDVEKLNTTNFPDQKNLTRDDYVIVLGDFGLIWDGSKEEKWWLRWFKKKKFTLLFIDGNHENHAKLNSYPVSLWNGGKVHMIASNIIHLMRGQVFVIDGLKFFTCGGAESTDKHRRIEGISWWKEETPSHAEQQEAYDNLDKHDFDVDYVLTHTCKSSIVNQLLVMPDRLNDPTSKFFEDLDDYLSYRIWFFGHFHIDRKIDDHTVCLFDTLVRIKSNK